MKKKKSISKYKLYTKPIKSINIQGIKTQKHARNRVFDS